ncbi:hypothetical protein HAX54_041810, partial [Datura stramonium]|nr:hypothetical protein [Datura stramonium]
AAVDVSMFELSGYVTGPRALARLWVIMQSLIAGPRALARLWVILQLLYLDPEPWLNYGS